MTSKHGYDPHLSPIPTKLGMVKKLSSDTDQALLVYSETHIEVIVSSIKIIFPTYFVVTENPTAPRWESGHNNIT